MLQVVLLGAEVVPVDEGVGAREVRDGSGIEFATCWVKKIHNIFKSRLLLFGDNFQTRGFLSLSLN